MAENTALAMTKAQEAVGCCSWNRGAVFLPSMDTFKCVRPAEMAFAGGHHSLLVCSRDTASAFRAMRWPWLGACREMVASVFFGKWNAASVSCPLHKPTNVPPQEMQCEPLNTPGMEGYSSLEPPGPNSTATIFVPTNSTVATSTKLHFKSDEGYLFPPFNCHSPEAYLILLVWPLLRVSRIILQYSTARKTLPPSR